MSKNIYTPYVYLIGWSNLQKYYYGVRYAKNCTPKDLWQSYFTSSKHVAAFRKKHGEPDIISIRKTFTTAKDACDWEHKVIKKMSMVESDNWLNYTDNMAIPPTKFERVENLTRRKRWKDYDEEVKNQIRKKARDNAIRMHKEGLINYKKPEDTTNYKKAALQRWADPEFKKRFSGQKWMKCHSNKTSKKVSPEEQQLLLKQGWSYGRVYKN